MFTLTDTAGDTGTNNMFAIIHYLAKGGLIIAPQTSGGSGPSLDVKNNTNSGETLITADANLVVRKDQVQGGAALGAETVGINSTSDALVVSPVAGATGNCLRSNNPGSTSTINFSVKCASGNIATAGDSSAATHSTATNCSSSASPAVCGSAAAGSVAVPTGVTPTLVVNTTAVTANSQILFTPDEGLGTKLGVTCNSTIAQVAVEPIVTARTAATSFTIQYNTTITVNPICLSYFIVN
jgi:hypothetical protein